MRSSQCSSDSHETFFMGFSSTICLCQMLCRFQSIVVMKRGQVANLSLYSLQIGKGRVPITRVPFSQAGQIFGNPAQLVTRPGGGSDARLVLQCKLLDDTLHALSVYTSEDSLSGMA